MEILGLLDTLESMILDSSKIPFTKKIVADEESLLGIIDKMRLVIQGGGGFAKDAIVLKQGAGNGIRGAEETSKEGLEGKTQEEAKAVEVLQEAYRMTKEIREGADKYADEILANLEATTTRIMRTIKAGRERLEKKK